MGINLKRKEVPLSSTQRIIKY